MYQDYSEQEAAEREMDVLHAEIAELRDLLNQAHAERDTARDDTTALRNIWRDATRRYIYTSRCAAAWKAAAKLKAAEIRDLSDALNLAHAERDTARDQIASMTDALKKAYADLDTARADVAEHLTVMRDGKKTRAVWVTEYPAEWPGGVTRLYLEPASALVAFPDPTQELSGLMPSSDKPETENS